MSEAMTSESRPDPRVALALDPVRTPESRAAHILDFVVIEHGGDVIRAGAQMDEMFEGINALVEHYVAEARSSHSDVSADLRAALDIIRKRGMANLPHRTTCSKFGFGLGGGSRKDYPCTCGRDTDQAIVDAALAAPSAGADHE